MNERDEEEFLLPGMGRQDTTSPSVNVLKSRPGVTIKRRKRNSSTNRGFNPNLSYFNLWWSRMHREGEKEENRCWKGKF